MLLVDIMVEPIINCKLTLKLFTPFGDQSSQRFLFTYTPTFQKPAQWHILFIPLNSVALQMSFVCCRHVAELSIKHKETETEHGDKAVKYAGRPKPPEFMCKPTQLPQTKQAKQTEAHLFVVKAQVGYSTFSTSN